MCDELEFHCIYCQSLSLVEFPLYIPHAKQQQICKSMRGKCTRTNSMHKPTSLKPSKTSPPLASIAEMDDKFYKANIVIIPPKVCLRTYLMMNTWEGVELYRGSEDCQNKV